MIVRMIIKDFKQQYHPFFAAKPISTLHQINQLISISVSFNSPNDSGVISRTITHSPYT